MPSEESTILCASRKWPAAARPTNRCAYRVVASFVADVVMSLLRAMAPVPALDFLPVPFRLVQANANRLEESYDKASLFRERKSRLRAGCCKTSGRAARDPRRDRRLSRLQLIPDNHEKFVPRSAAGWRFPQSVEKTARPSGRRARRKLRWFVLPPHAEQSRRTNLECAARFPDCRAELRRASPLFCAAPRRAQNPVPRWPFRAPPRKQFAGTRRRSEGTVAAGSPPRRTLPWCSLQSTARGTFSSGSKCNRGTRGRGEF